MIDVAVVPVNGWVGEMITVVGDRAVLIGGVGEVFETSTLIEVFVVSSLGKDVPVTEDVEMVAESAIVVISFFAVVITVPKFFAVVVGAVIPIAEDDRVVDISVGESFKFVEGVIGIRMGLLAVTDDEDIERVLELVDIIIESNVVIRADIIEGIKSAEDLTEVVRPDLIAVGTDSALMVELIIR